MKIPKIDEAIPLIGTTLGGVVTGAFATNGFAALGWGLEWETLVAGALGLTGGWLAYKAATDQRRATENRNEYIFKAKHLADLHQAENALEECRFLVSKEPEIVVSETDIQGLVMAVSKPINDAACFEQPLPTELTKQLEILCRTLPQFKRATAGISRVAKTNEGMKYSIEDPISLTLSYTALHGSLRKFNTYLVLDELNKTI
ncbi:hypothetical protein [Thalassospira xiamenensis]|uniref:hypothetical protein n=1 Tax=Thalassospira xiamenensis TaxID=220697 RepID=UPI001E4D34F5|nr:hypothetical protein [Thalassospira xiamenensis]MCD1593375.1 hypothetical protein [Thalassospira xiamenensis]